MRAGVMTGMRLGPLPFVAVDVQGDRRRPPAHRAHVVGKLQYFSSSVLGVAVRGQRGPQLRIGGRRGVPNPVDCTQEVPDPDGVQPAPFLGREHAGEQLQVRIPAREV